MGMKIIANSLGSLMMENCKGIKALWESHTYFEITLLLTTLIEHEIDEICLLR